MIRRMLQRVWGWLGLSCPYCRDSHHRAVNAEIRAARMAAELSDVLTAMRTRTTGEARRWPS